MDITPEDFERFLTWLDPDREQAIATYQIIRLRLIRYFEYKRCGVDSEELADETINRVTRKVPEIADTYVGERWPYFLRFASYVLLEWLNRRKTVPISFDPEQPPSSDDDKELQDRCLQRCLKHLSDNDRDLILRYYTGEKHEKIEERKKLADERGIAPNALRIRSHRIRTQLRECVEKCVAEENDG
ncbi:MAG TPA: hypothetical protein VFF31_14765 [Blastocatellia bacterium]|nr:hypothetical protein [Blastocatellia bacterium]